MKLIGYQGEVGSNAWAVAMKYIETQKEVQIEADSWESVPLVNSLPVLLALQEGRIQIGVVAVNNTLGGEVQETKEALEQLADGLFRELSRVTIPIHHCLFCKGDPAKVTTIVSHPQALLQTKGNRSRLYPKLREEAYADTALAAIDLASGKLPESTAVLCRKEAGEMQGLHLMVENLEDSKENRTTFLVLERKIRKESL